MRPAIYGPPGPENANLRYRIRRETYLAQGICPHCCVADVVPDKTRCAACARSNSIRVAQRQKERAMEKESTENG